MIGGGVFNLPSDMSRGASPGAILIGWIITGIGMLMLAFVYQSLAVRKPELNAGPYAYAKAGFGNFVGFNSAWGYWLSAFLGNVAYAVAIFSALSYFFPVFGDGNNLPSIIGASLCLWLIYALVMKGIKEAAFVNVITTIAKLVPLFLFILIAIIAFNWDKFTFNFWGQGECARERRSRFNPPPSEEHDAGDALGVHRHRRCQRLFSSRSQAFGRRARHVDRICRRLGIYVLVSLLSTGILSQPELAGLKVPSMAGVLEPLVGAWGAALINLGLMISVGGAFLSWTLLCAEIPFTCGRDGTFPKWFGAENENGSPANALLATTILIQLFLILSFFSKNAYQFFYFIASVAILPPYVLSGAYALKLALSGEGYGAGDRSRNWDILVGALATVYGLWLVYAAGLNYLLMCAILFAPGILVYMQARRERGEPVFVGFELVLAILIALLAVVAAYLMWTGEISPL